MPRPFPVTLFAALAVASAFGTPARAAPAVATGVRAAIDLDPGPSWSSNGSWVKHSSPVVVDIDPSRHNGPEILVGTQGGKLYALRFAGGQLVKVWDSGGAIDTYIDSSPAAADLDGDGCLEVLVGAGNEFRPGNSGVHVFNCDGAGHRFFAAPGAAKASHVGVFSTPAIGDVDGDGALDVAYASFNQKVYVKRRDGSDLLGWAGGRENYDSIWSSPAMADVDGDGRNEIFVGTDLGGGAPVFACARGIRGTVSAFDASARFLPGFPKCMDTPIYSSPSVQDVNGDGVLDVIVGTNNYTENNANVGQPWKVRAFNTLTGALQWETALEAGTRIFSSPAVGDVTGDGRPEVSVGTQDDHNYGEVYLLDGASGATKWHHEGGHLEACACMFMGSPVFADVSGDGIADVVAASEDGAVMAWDGDGNVLINDYHPGQPPGRYWEGESYMFFNSPAVADLDGDGRNEIVVASARAGSQPLRGRVWVLSSDGTKPGPWPVFKRTADRRSSLGTGPARGNAPAPAKTAAPRRASTARPRGATPLPSAAVATATPETEAPSPEPSTTLRAIAAPRRTSGGRGTAGAAAGAIAFGGSVAALVVRRKMTARR